MKKEDTLIVLSRAIVDNHLCSYHDWNEGDIDYSCLFCDSNTITIWERASSKGVENKIEHQSDCPVLLAKRTLVMKLGANYDEASV